MKLRKQDFASPKREDLKKGNILPIYGEYTTQENFRGNARLIERKKSSWRDEDAGFIRAVVGGREIREGWAVMWKHQRWVIQYVDGPYEGHKTCANIGYFHSFSFLDKGGEEE